MPPPKQEPDQSPDAPSEATPVSDLRAEPRPSSSPTRAPKARGDGGFLPSFARVFGFLAAAGVISLPFTAMLDWIRQDAPPFITDLACEAAETPGTERTPALDSTQPITIGVGEKLVCGVEQEGGDYVVWRGGGNGFKMQSGPVRPIQESGFLERLRQRLSPTPLKQETGCISSAKPAQDETSAARNFPECRALIEYSTPGNYQLTVRVSKRGNQHVEELSLPIRVVEAGTVLRIPSVEILSPPGVREGLRTGSFSEALAPPAGFFGSAREDTRRVPVIPLEPGETVAPDSAHVAVRSSNGASIQLEVTPEAVVATVYLRSGAGFDRHRAWATADVTATVQSEVGVPPITIGPIALRVPNRRRVFSQPIPDGATFQLQYEGRLTETIGLDEWTSAAPHGSRLRFIRTDLGLVAEAGNP